MTVVARLYRQPVMRTSVSNGNGSNCAIFSVPLPWMKNRALILRDTRSHLTISPYEEQDAFNDLMTVVDLVGVKGFPKVPCDVHRWRRSQKWRGTLRAKSGFTLLSAHFEGQAGSGVFYHFSNTEDKALYNLRWQGEFPLHSNDDVETIARPA